MALRYLFGPVSAAFSDHCLGIARQRGDCLSFGLAEGGDITVGLADPWEDVCSRFPPGWYPDFVALHLPYQLIPGSLWTAPVPVVGLAIDWNLLWHYYQHCLPACSLVLADTAGVEALARQGIHQARVANLFGPDKLCPDSPLLPPRDIDVLFVGNFSAAVQRERLAWLGRLATLADRWRVVLAAGVHGDDYRQLLARARIVFNRSIRGECNARVFEATTAGALLFQEADNREVAAYFQDGQEFVSYRAYNLEHLLSYYLEHEDQRREIAAAGCQRAQQYSFAMLWDQALAQIEPELLNQSALIQRPPSPEQLMLLNCWQTLQHQPRGAIPEIAGLKQALAANPTSAALHHWRGVSLSHMAQRNPAFDRSPIADAFRKALEHDPSHVLASLNLAETLIEMDQRQPAIEQARQALTILERRPRLADDILRAPHVPALFDHFRVEWERAAWSHAGQPDQEALAKHQLLRWRLHSLLADLTGDLGHFYEAAVARPDLPATRAALGCALARGEKFPEAAAHLAQATADNPFDTAAARAYFGVLGERGDQSSQRRLARERRLLAQAAPGLVPKEEWFIKAPPVGDELASLIILCCNQLDFTRQCLESVLRHTRPPFELLLIDNGSSDGTPAYLQQIGSRPGPVRVVAIRNDVNLGFAAGCNQGLAEARGRYLVLLNNDTIVTPGWLDGLIGWSHHNWPHVGIVGPMTSCASPPQELPIHYRNPEELLAFAAERQKTFAGQALTVQRLIGFCMLIRREVWEKVGGLDEDFGLGFFEDDDLCIRVREAGFQLVMALNVFVHHFGNRTFRGLGIDAQAQLETNFHKFRAKWGDDYAAGYRLRAPAADAEPAPTVVVGPPSSTPAKPARVSLCIITKNEERHLGACLASAADLVGEIIVIDTGSTDRTKEIARQAGAQVYDFAWIDSFAAARNECLRHASGDWIFWLDADECLDQTNRQRLRELFACLPDQNLAYIMRQLSPLEVGTHAAAQVDQVRLFRNRSDIRWQYRVHEQILLAVRRSGGDVRFTDIVIDHCGYTKPEVQGPKVDRNLRLLEMELAEHPDDHFVAYNLGAVLLTQGKNTEALDLFQRSLRYIQPGDLLLRKLHALIARTHQQLSQPAEALAACHAGLAAFPEDGELLFWQAIVLRDQKDLDGAAAALQRVLQAHPPQHFTSIDAGLYTYRARHFLGEIFRDQHRLEEAETQWRAAVAEFPDFSPSWLELGKLYCRQKRWPELDAVVIHLESGPHAPSEVLLLRGQAHLARKDFSAAQDLLQALMARAPEAVLPRILFSHALLQEGKDWEAAKAALLDVLALDPLEKEAQHNLRVLRERHPQLWSVDSEGLQRAPPPPPLGMDVAPTGAAAPSGAVEPEIVIHQTADQSPQTLSLCMIVRNEEENLPGCLRCIADLVDNIVVVDTGSTDRTKELALEHGAKVYDFPWIDHFAAARNESLKHATGKWILWLDADDRIDEENRAKLRQLFASLKDETAGYVMKCMCLPDARGVTTVVDHLRLFRNHPQVRWTFRVHEQILPSLRAIQANVHWSDVVIQHTGYVDPALRQRKLQRDLRLLHLEQAEQPDHAFTLFNLGNVYQELGRVSEALEMFHRSLSGSAPHDSIVRKLYAQIVHCQRTLGQPQEALAACREGLSLFTDDIELLFQQGVSLKEAGDLAEAAASWERCLSTVPGTHFASVNTGLRGHITRHNLATVYVELGRVADAESQWLAALAEQRHYEPAWRGLVTLFLEQKRWQELEELVSKVEAGPQGPVHAAAIISRSHLAREEFGAARRLLEEVVAREPEAMEVLLLLSHALLHEGKDWPAAEKVLRDILRLDPQNAEAQHNLTVLLRRQGRQSEKPPDHRPS
jgi:glycosyltransferase involved in cell wall biosynthesis/predicted Zn-dependent protease